MGVAAARRAVVHTTVPSPLESGDHATEARHPALVLERPQAKRPLARRSQHRPGAPCEVDATPAHRADRAALAGEWREALGGADAEGHQGGDEGARTPSQAGNLLSALRGTIRWMIDQGHLDEDGGADRDREKGCHGIRKARAEVAAYGDCTESQMMAIFGWTAPKTPAHCIAQANREKLGMTGMEKIVAFDQSQSLDAARCERGRNVRRERSRNFAH